MDRGVLAGVSVVFSMELDGVFFRKIPPDWWEVDFLQS